MCATVLSPASEQLTHEDEELVDAPLLEAGSVLPLDERFD
jgi:hypothetical protein